MPKVRGLTPEQRLRAADDDLRKRTTIILKTMIANRDITRKELAERADVQYDSMNRCIRDGRFVNTLALARILDVLKADPTTRAALLGSREKCRFEPGYVEVPQ